MTNTKTRVEHTPGPWRLDFADDGFLYIMGADDVSFLEGGLVREHDVENEANARLIASAPDLLAALEAAHDNMRDVDSHLEADICWCTYSAAIRRARGEE